MRLEYEIHAEDQVWFMVNRYNRSDLNRRLINHRRNLVLLLFLLVTIPLYLFFMENGYPVLPMVVGFVLGLFLCFLYPAYIRWKTAQYIKTYVREAGDAITGSRVVELQEDGICTWSRHGVTKVYYHALQEIVVMGNYTQVLGAGSQAGFLLPHDRIEPGKLQRFLNELRERMKPVPTETVDLVE